MTVKDSDRRKEQLPSIVDHMGVRVAQVVMAVYAYSVLAPYALILLAKTPIDIELIKIITSNKSTVDLITTAVVMFYFGASVQRRKDQETLGTLVDTNAAQVKALAPVVGAVLDTDTTVSLEPGETAKVTATESGTEIKPTP